MDPREYPAILTQAEPGKVPEGEIVAYFNNRDELKHALSRLSAANFPMQTLFVVGRNITQVEYLGGKITYPRVILSSAISGAMFGALIGFVSALFTGTAVVPHLLTSIPLGIVVWVLTGLWSYSRAQAKGGDSFAMTSQTIPGSLELRAHFSSVEQARQILAVGQYRNQAMPQPDASWTGPREDTANPFVAQQQLPPSPQEATSFVGPEYNKDGSKAGGKFGLRIEDAEEYAATVRQQPLADETTNERIQKIREEHKQQRYGIRVDDPAEFAQTIRKAPEPEDE